MPIINSKSHPDKNLIEYYTEASRDTDFTTREIGRAMVKWIRAIEKKLPNIQIWGLTSHYRLVLMASETSRGDWSVIIRGQKGNYRVDYLIPRDEAPWENAYVMGETNEFHKALEMTLVAIDNCGAWGENII